MSVGPLVDSSTIYSLSLNFSITLATTLTLAIVTLTPSQLVAFRRLYCPLGGCCCALFSEFMGAFYRVGGGSGVVRDSCGTVVSALTTMEVGPGGVFVGNCYGNFGWFRLALFMY